MVAKTMASDRVAVDQGLGWRTNACSRVTRSSSSMPSTFGSGCDEVTAAASRAWKGTKGQASFGLDLEYPHDHLGNY